MSYFKVKEYKNNLEDFKKLTLEYWSKLPKQHHNEFLGKFKYQDNDESLMVRERITRILPYVQEAANYLGVGYICQSYPAPAVGGPLIPVDIFRSVIEPELGHSILDRKLIVDTINISISRADKQCKDEFIQMLLPWNWIIDLCAFIIRIPFLILRRAGLSAKIEENIISQILKIAFLIILTWLIYKGLIDARIVPKI